MHTTARTLFILALPLVTLAGCSGGEGDSTAASRPAAGASSFRAAAPGDAVAPTADSAVRVRQFDSSSDQGWTASFQVISSPKGNILIDPGKYDDEVAAYVTSIGAVDAILITHGHWDKLRGLDDAMAANPDATAYIHELDQPYLLDPTRNCSIEDGFEGTTSAKTTTLKEGTSVAGGYSIETIHLPGHTEGSSIFYFKDENLLIGGDTIMPNLVGSSRHPGGDEQDRQASIAKFKKLTFPDVTLYHGHGEPTSYAELMKSNVDLRSAHLRRLRVMCHAKRPTPQLRRRRRRRCGEVGRRERHTFRRLQVRVHRRRADRDQIGLSADPRPASRRRQSLKPLASTCPRRPCRKTRPALPDRREQDHSGQHGQADAGDRDAPGAPPTFIRFRPLKAQPERGNADRTVGVGDKGGLCDDRCFWA